MEPHADIYASAGGRLLSGISLAHRRGIAGALSACFITSGGCHAVTQPRAFVGRSVSTLEQLDDLAGFS